MKIFIHIMNRILPLLLLVTLASGCGKANQKKIIGKWYGISDNAIYEFFDDGTLTLSFEAKPWLDREPSLGKWDILSNDRVHIDASVGNTNISATFFLDFKDNEMVFTMTNGSASYRHKRIEQPVPDYRRQEASKPDP